MPHKIDLKFRLAVAACLALSLLSAFAWLAPAAAPTAASAQAGGSLFVRKILLAATPTPSPTPVAALVRQFTLATNNLAYNTATQELYATLETEGSVARINTSKGAAESPIFVGSEPMKMAFSDDGQTMYVSLFGQTPGVRRVDLRTRAAGIQFPMGLGGSQDDLPCYLAVMPGAPDTVAVVGLRGITAIYDNGVRRPQTSTAGALTQQDGSALHFGSIPARLYSGYPAGPMPIRKLTASPEGISEIGVIHAAYGGTTTYFDKTRGLLFSSLGDIIDPEADIVLGRFSGLHSESVMAVDPAVGRVYFLTGATGYPTTWELLACDTNTYLPVGSALLSGIEGRPSDLVRWGSHGLAFRTYSGRVVLVETALVSEPQPAVTGVRFMSSSLTTDESVLTLVINVVRTGDITGQTTVAYVTSDGTAAAGSDYTAASGTLTFSGGESAKTFSVPIINDTRDEPSESVTLTLSGPTGGASLGSPSTATLIITNDDRPLFRFGAASYAVGEADGQVLLTAKRTGDPSAPVSVDYTTGDGTANEKADYTLTLGTLRFAAGEIEKTVAVLVTDDVLVEPNPSLKLVSCPKYQTRIFAASFPTLLCRRSQLILTAPA